jgi:hypothetical protein
MMAVVSLRAIPTDVRSFDETGGLDRKCQAQLRKANDG